MLQETRLENRDCYHCGLTVETGNQFTAELNGETQVFCCPACRAIAATIIDHGLGDFYHYQSFPGQAADEQMLQETFLVFDDPDFFQRYVRTSSEKNRGSSDRTLAYCELLIGGMHCSACVWLLEKYLMELPGVEWVSVNFSEQRASVSWDVDQVKLSDICQAVGQLGYQPEPYNADEVARLRKKEHHQFLRRLGVAGIGMMQVGMFAIALYAGALQGIEQEYRDFMRWTSMLVATPIVFYSAAPFFIGAWRGLKMRQPGMDLPVAVAIGLAYLASCHATLTGGEDVYFDSVTMFTFLLLAGRFLEMRARHHGSSITSDLAGLLPSVVTEVERGGEGVQQHRIKPLFKVAVGDHLLVKPGQVIAADGVLLDGNTSVNEAQLTGEFMPQSKAAGDTLVAGSVNVESAITMRVTAGVNDSKWQLINELLVRGQMQKPAMAQLADRYASYFVSAILAIAVVTFLYWYLSAGGQYSDNAFWIMLSVLVVSCPCALSLATPAAITAATNQLRSRGMLVTQSSVWETLPGVTDVVFDKTGTLTAGELSIANIVPVSTLSQQQCLELAVALEQYSEHPIANAFCNLNTDGGLPAVENVQLIAGQGVEAIINGQRLRIGQRDYALGVIAEGSVNDSFQEVQKPGDGHWILLSSDEQPLCWFQLQDQLRAETAEVVEHLRQQGLTLHMLSGDSSGTAEQLSEQLALDHCISGASSTQKLEYIEQLQHCGAKVLMLGDGINDAPVLAAADVSVAMSNAASIAKTHADCIFLSGKINLLLALIQLATATNKVIRQNIVWALAYNLSAIPLAAMGWIPPYLAAIGMSLSSLVVIVNALRLQKNKMAMDDRDLRLLTPAEVA